MDFRYKCILLRIFSALPIGEKIKMPMHLAPNIQCYLFPADELVMSNSFCRYTSFYKSVKKFLFPKSPIKTITDLRKVCL